MKKTITLLTVLLSSIYLFAQIQPVGNLTVFSEDGDKFFLILNGEKQNDVPQSNIRIEELPQPYYNARIIFQDSTIAVLSKSNLMIASADGVLMDVTYKIRRDNNGKPKLGYYSSIPVQSNFIPPSGMYVRHFGRREPVDVVTTTTTTTTAPNTTSAAVSVNGVGVSVTINDPTIIPAVTEQTTVTTTSSSSNNNTNNNTYSNSSRGCNGWPMKEGDFIAAKKTITGASFEESKLSTAKTIAASNCLSTNQVIELCKLFDFEDSKLSFSQYAYKYTTDPKNYFKVGAIFTFDSSRDKLNAFLTGN